MASKSTVLSLGFGLWGSVNLLPTLGFGLAPAVAMTLIIASESAYGDLVTVGAVGDGVVLGSADDGVAKGGGRA